MAHYNSYESFKTKKSIKKKEQAKNKSLVKTKDDFVVSKSLNYGIVLEVKYNDIFEVSEERAKEILMATYKNKPVVELVKEETKNNKKEK